MAYLLSQSAVRHFLEDSVCAKHFGDESFFNEIPVMLPILNIDSTSSNG